MIFEIIIIYLCSCVCEIFKCGFPFRAKYYISFLFLSIVFYSNLFFLLLAF